MTRRRFGEGVLLVLLVLAAYLPTLSNGFVWDDDANVTENRTVQSADGVVRIWTNPLANQQYYPLTHTSHWLLVRMFGLAPWAHHVANLLLQIAAAILVFTLLTHLRLPGAWLAAALFAIHPLQVESVAWVTERKNLLAMVFLLPAVLLQLRHAGVLDSDPGETRPTSGASTGVVCWPAVALFAAALLAKTAVAGAPVATLAIVWWKRGRIRRDDLVSLIPFFVLAVGLGLATAGLERRHFWVSGSDWSPTLPERVLIAGRVFWFYLGKFVWPLGQVFIYPRWQIDAGRLLGWAAPVAVVAVVAVLARASGRIGRGPMAAAVAYGALIAPASGFFYVYFFQFSFVQDHFQYFACVVPASLSAAAVWRLLPRPALRAVASAALLLVLGVLSWQRARLFRDSETLWLDTIARNPTAWLAQYNLGLARVEAGRLDEGVALYSEALRANPTFSLAHYNLARALQQLGRDDEAVRHYEEAVRLRPDEPMAHNNLGLLLLGRGRADEALSHYEDAIAADPTFAPAHLNRANALMSRGRLEEALIEYDAVLRLTPTLAEVQLYRGMVLSRLGRRQPAVEAFRAAIRLRDDLLPARERLAAELHAVGDVEGARRELREFQRRGGVPRPALVETLTRP